MSNLLWRSANVGNTLRIFGMRSQTQVSSKAAILRYFSSEKATTAPRAVSNEPIKFVGSAAASWNAKTGRAGNVDPHIVPWFQPYVVVGSVAVFLIYFCYLREENDLDRELEASLFDRVPGLEESQLMMNYKYNIEHHLSNKEVIDRMKEIGIKVEDIKI
ncbi:unnamed protein product [Diamesa serratosioi]